MSQCLHYKKHISYTYDSLISASPSCFYIGHTKYLLHFENKKTKGRCIATQQLGSVRDSNVYNFTTHESCTACKKTYQFIYLYVLVRPKNSPQTIIDGDTFLFAYMYLTICVKTFPFQNALTRVVTRERKSKLSNAFQGI